MFFIVSSHLQSLDNAPLRSQHGMPMCADRDQDGATEPSSSQTEPMTSPFGAKPVPFAITDMPLADRGLKGWRLTKRLHEAAVAAERDTYIDPPTGYTVFTARYVQSRPVLAAHYRCKGRH